ncbi:MAG: lactate utilization protein C [Mycobacterium sp.]
MTASRDEVFDRIRSALGTGSSEPIPIPRDYHRQPLAGPGDSRRFAETAADYRAQVTFVDRGSIADAISGLIREGETVVVPADLPGEWIGGVDVVVDSIERPLTLTHLDRVAAVLTGCALGIAATGTIVLDGGFAQGRRAITLVPDHHICIVFADQIVDTVPQAFAAIDPRRPLTFISGPSATSDIELNRVEGVHGPRRLNILIAAR